MNIRLIAALSDNYVIGNDNQLPWRLPNDLQHFKALTLNKTIIMGRKTYESLGKALPSRTNVVITRNTELSLPDAQVFHSLDAAVKAFADQSEICIIGGAQVFQEALPLATHLSLTWVKADIKGDATFPAINFEEWIEKSRESHKKDDKHFYTYEFVEYEKH